MEDDMDCEGTWKEVYTTRPHENKDTVLRCSGCGSWMFIHPDGTADTFGPFK